MLRVALLEFPVFPDGYPLVSGYLQAYAQRSEDLRDACTFEIHSIPLKSEGLESRVLGIDADVYGISCYVWNMALVRRLLPRLLDARPHARVILGGPQVMRNAQRYVDPSQENVVVCNGEGERTFAQYLQQQIADSARLSEVNGLSFYRDGVLHTTDPEPRIRSIDDVPSPYLAGIFDPGLYTWAPIETNRGCPFRCTYCFWGAATNAKVHRFDEARVRQELTWLSENKALFVLFIDANFGMYERDVEFARLLAECRRTNGYPLTVGFSSSKNTPRRVTEITREFQEAGLIATQPISLQTISDTALGAVRRDNIATRDYIDLQATLNEQGTSSFIEIIWPLPGETLASFQQGLETLCSSGADSFLIYPLLLINNVELETQREDLALETVRDPDRDSEAEIVISTKDVCREDFIEGLRFGYHVIGAYTIRGMRLLGTLLHESGRMTWAALLREFGGFCRRQHRDNPYTRLVEDSLATLAAGEPGTFFDSDAALLHLALHEHRAEVDRLFAGFVESMGLSTVDVLQLHLELDLFARPYLYLCDEVAPLGIQCRILEEVTRDDGRRLVAVPEPWRDTVAGALGLPGPARGQLLFHYTTTQLPYMAGQGFNVAYCQDRHRRIRSILPAVSWTGGAVDRPDTATDDNLDHLVI